MAIKRVGVVLLLAVFSFAGWQVWNLASVRRPTVLAETTTSKTKTLEERVKSLENRVYVLEKNAGLVVTASTVKVKESFVSLLGGDISGTDWTKISGTDFTLDASLYGKNIEVSWQGWLEGGSGSVRLYDSTNHRAVDYSQFSSTGDTKTSFYSKAMSIWRGQNQYYIEGKTNSGTVTLSSPRLRILVK
jgi:hypothetical protein